MRNEMKLSFLSVSENEAFARTAVAAFVAQFNPAIDELADIRTAVSEAVTNAIVHGYREEKGYVHLTVKVSDDRVVYIQVKDSGCGIKDLKMAMQPLYTTACDEERAGLGFAVMESFMDKLDVKSKYGYGTKVSMKKVLLSVDNEEYR